MCACFVASWACVASQIASTCSACELKTWTAHTTEAAEQHQPAHGMFLIRRLGQHEQGPAKACFLSSARPALTDKLFAKGIQGVLPHQQSQARFLSWRHSLCKPDSSSVLLNRLVVTTLAGGAQ